MIYSDFRIVSSEDVNILNAYQVFDLQRKFGSVPSQHFTNKQLLFIFLLNEIQKDLIKTGQCLKCNFLRLQSAAKKKDNISLICERQA